MINIKGIEELKIKENDIELKGVKLERVLEEDLEKIRDMMIKIFKDETFKWFKDGNKPFIPGYNSIDMQRYHTWDNKYYKIIYNENLIGVTLISYTGKEHARIDRLYIIPEYQGIGIGKDVINLIEDMFPNVKIWTLDTIKESVRNHKFYEKMGYKLIEEDDEERYYNKILNKKISDSSKYIRYKDISHSNFRECNMEYSDLYASNMSNSRFSNTNLFGNIYSNSYLGNNRFTNVNMNGSIFADSRMNEVEMCHVSLLRAHIHDINLDVKEDANITIERCKLTNSKIVDSNLRDLKIENCNIDGMTIDSIKVSELIHCYNKNYIKNK
ncbi:GNAT family N-acetyltransferase [Clostridium sardiniense]